MYRVMATEPPAKRKNNDCEIKCYWSAKQYKYNITHQSLGLQVCDVFTVQHLSKCWGTEQQPSLYLQSYQFSELKLLKFKCLFFPSLTELYNRFDPLSLNDIGKLSNITFLPGPDSIFCSSLYTVLLHIWQSISVGR